MGIFSAGPPSHSDFLQKYGKNLHSTFPGEIQLLTTYGRVGVCDTYCTYGATGQARGKMTKD
jgi:hypothetical protein